MIFYVSHTKELRNWTLHPRTKNIDVEYNFFRDMVKDIEVKLLRSLF